MPKHTRKRHHFSDEQKQIIKDHYADSTPQEMESLLGGSIDRRSINHKAKKMGIKKSQAYCEKYGICPSGRIKPGAKPWNKGISYEAGGRSKQTQFKPGTIPPNQRPIGATRISKDGYIEIKVESGMHKFRLLHRENWKKRHGKYPPKGFALIFKDGNKQNCEVENLQLVTRAQLMQMNTVHTLPKELKEVVYLKTSLTRRINGTYYGRRKKRHHDTEIDPVRHDQAAQG
ncbi:MAG: HNH endonuclease [Nitrosomonas sp.]|uniref:HNH endonuclease signature motif containing protein n=1 Tax=Nitrosomonas sp. TaxID=42353 RepID=UPI0025F8878E|nr:HNH endonuclease signature motif containing protein [Nitrosomonas sp.]MBY0474186.1 HNH endonuclease [Nitrosomonas sp.]